jgi:hypothetical protein
MGYQMRPGRPDDAEICGRICYDAFYAIATRHGFPPDFDTPEAATGLISVLLGQADFYSVVAESGGRIVGSNFLGERSCVVGVGPVTDCPGCAGRRRGHVPDAGRDGAGQCPQGAGYPIGAGHVSHPLAVVVREAGLPGSGPVGLHERADPRRRGPRVSHPAGGVGGYRGMWPGCRHVHGHDRNGEVVEAVARGSAVVVERAGRVTGYATSLGLFGHAVGETNEDIEALLSSAERFDGPGVLVPTSNTELFAWCLNQGFRVIQLATLMTSGFYQQPRGAAVCSVFF